MGVECKRARHATTQHAFKYKVQCTKARQFIAPDRTRVKLAQLIAHPGNSDLLAKQRVILGTVGDDGNIRGISLIARP